MCHKYVFFVRATYKLDSWLLGPFQDENACIQKFPPLKNGFIKTYTKRGNINRNFLIFFLKGFSILVSTQRRTDLQKVY